MNRFKFIFSLIAFLTVSCVYASGGALGSDDFFASMVVVAFLAIALGLVYLFSCINRIFRDPDYRGRIKTNFTAVYKNLIDRLKKEQGEYLPFQQLNGALKTTNYA